MWTEYEIEAQKDEGKKLNLGHITNFVSSSACRLQHSWFVRASSFVFVLLLSSSIFLLTDARKERGKNEREKRHPSCSVAAVVEYTLLPFPNM